jgi:malate dehydrogenase (oxaloacetate-decarboxylating)
MFRGVLDVRASTISNGMAITAAYAIAQAAEDRGIRPDYILPRMEEWEVVPRVAAAVAVKAQQEGLARIARTSEQLYLDALHTIKEARRALQILMREQLIRSSGE